MIQIKRAYGPASDEDGQRILVDRLWPRGVRKGARNDRWPKEISPSTGLRKWFAHDPEKWSEFQGRFVKELEGHASEPKELAVEARSGTVTLV